MNLKEKILIKNIFVEIRRSNLLNRDFLHERMIELGKLEKSLLKR